MTTFADGLYQWGGTPVGVASIPTTAGQIYFVNASNGPGGQSGSDGNTGRSPGQAWATLAYAYSQVLDGNDDVICLIGNTAQTLSTTLYVTKSRVHFLGLDAGARQEGQGQRITIAATSGATNIAAIVNLGTCNSFQNILIDSSSTVAQGLYAFVDGGVGLQCINCRFVITSQLTVTGAADLVLNGTRSQFNDCIAGGMVEVPVGAIIRPAILCTAAIAGVGLTCTANIFSGGYVLRNGTNAANRLVYAANATDISLFLTFRGTGFLNLFGATAMAQAIATGATLTAGSIVLDPNCYAQNVTKVSTSTGVIVTGAAVNASTGIGVNAA